jgi:hypothetical protein
MLLTSLRSSLFQIGIQYDECSFTRGSELFRRRAYINPAKDHFYKRQFNKSLTLNINRSPATVYALITQAILSQIL